MFIKLTNGGFEFPVIVNSDDIISIWPSDRLGKGSEIKFRRNHKPIHVLEDQDEILAALAETGDRAK
jgi:hypothetical protein